MGVVVPAFRSEMNAQLARLPEVRTVVSIILYYVTCDLSYSTVETYSLLQWFEYFAALIRTHEGSCPPFLGAYVNYGKLRYQPYTTTQYSAT